MSPCCRAGLGGICLYTVRRSYAT